MTTELPWNRWQPEQPPEPVVIPPEPVPGPDKPLDDLLERVGPDIPREALSAALDDLWPAIKDKALGYAHDSWERIRKGQTVDVLHPTVTAETAAGKELVVADARSRSARTFLQGLIFDLFAGLVAVIATLAGADPFQKQTWIAFGVLLLKTFVSAGISYVMRLRVQPTIKTPGRRMNVMPVPTQIVEEQAP